MSEPAIEIEGLVKAFRGKTVLDDIDLAVPRGQVFGYVGPNGAGKSTTVKILVGMLHDYRGRVRVGGFDVGVHPDEVKRRIGYVPESAALYETLTAFEHLQLVGRLHGLDDAVIESRAAGLFDAFDLAARASSRIGSLSKGMRQKLLFAAALLHDPEILFLDEPLSGLDVHSTVLVKELVSAFAGSGRTVFYCSHMMDVVERVCDRIAILDGGRIVADGSFAELAASHRDQPSLERIFVDLTRGGDAVDRARAVMRAVADGGG